MIILTVTKQRRITVPKNVLRHLSVKPGEKVELHLLPNGQAMLQQVRQVGSIDDFIGLLAGKSAKPLTIEEMSEIAGASWAGRK